MSSTIPADIAQFIVEKIDSVAQVEALLLLRSAPEQEWDVETVAKRLYVDEGQAATTLTRLQEERLIVRSALNQSRYRYEPTSSNLRQLVDRLADIYAKQLVPITNLIHSKPKSRVQEFADAFKLRKDD
jgi:predicted transcriptional regulator